MTKAIEPGKVNEVVVAIKDRYYAIAQTGDPKNPSVRHMFNVPTDWFYSSGGVGTTRYADLPVLLQVQRRRHLRDAVVRRRRPGLHLRRLLHPVGEEEGTRPGNQRGQPDRRARSR